MSEAKRAGREGEFYVFHLGFGRTSRALQRRGPFGASPEVATASQAALGRRQLAAFREFAGASSTSSPAPWWNLGSAGPYADPAPRHQHRRALFIEVRPTLLRQTEPKAQEIIVQLEARLLREEHPRNMIGREKRVVALEQYPLAGEQLRPGARRLRARQYMTRPYW